MGGYRRFCQRRSNFFSNFIKFFLVDEGAEPNPTILRVIIGNLNGVPLKAQLECWLGSFVLFQGIKETLYLCDFSGGSGPLCPPSESGHEYRGNLLR